MSIWSNIAKMAGGAAKGTWGFAKAGGRSLGNTVIHPAQTLKGAGSAMKTKHIKTQHLWTALGFSDSNYPGIITEPDP